MKLKHALIALFILIVIIATNKAFGDVKISLGTAFNTADMTYGEVSYEYKGWEAAATLFGRGETQYKARQEQHEAYSISKLIRPQWCVLGGCNYYRLGVAHVSNSKLVGEMNYRLGVGIEWDNVSVEYAHYSSAGINKPNTGIDGIQLRIHLPLGEKYED